MQGRADEILAGVQSHLPQQACSMGFNGVGTDLQSNADIAAGRSLHDELQDLSLACGQGIREVRLIDLSLFQQGAFRRIGTTERFGNSRTQVMPTGNHFAYGLEEFVAAGFFGDISRSTGFHGFQYIGLISAHGKNNDTSTQFEAQDFSCGVEPVQPRHHQVDNQHLGFLPLDEFDRLEPISRFAHNDASGVRLHQRPQPLPYNYMVIRQHNSSHCNVFSRGRKNVSHRIRHDS